MSGINLNQLVRDQILAEGPDIASELDPWPSQDAHERRCENYVNEELNAMSRAELLERISDALTTLRDLNAPSPRDIADRLGI